MTSAMRHVRFGSYSIADTFAGTPNFSRRKSMRRYWRLCPPPRQRVVMWPLLLRPPDFVSGSTSERSGSVFVTSAKSETDRKRVALVTGLNCRIPMSALEDLDRVAFLQRHDRLLPRAAGPRVAPVGAPLRAHHQRAHVGHRHLEQRLNRRLDLRLRRLWMTLERVRLVGLEGRRGLLGDERPHDHLMELRPRSPPPRSRPPPRPPRPRAPPPRPPRRPTTARRTLSCRRTAPPAPAGGCGPRGTRCARARRPPSATAPCARPHRASRAARRAASSWGSRTPARRSPAAHPRPPGRSMPTCGRAAAPSWGSPAGSPGDGARRPRRRAASAARGSIPAGRVPCPSAATASGCPPRRRDGSWWRACPGAG